MVLEQWAQRLCEAGLDHPVDWENQPDSVKAVWRRAAGVLVAEQARLIAIEHALQAQNASLAPWRSVEELRSWASVATRSNRDLDAYLRQVYPTLEKYYGMPTDGVRIVINALRKPI